MRSREACRYCDVRGPCPCYWNAQRWVFTQEDLDAAHRLYREAGGDTLRALRTACRMGDGWFTLTFRSLVRGAV
jgi:hypothetical protein